MMSMIFRLANYSTKISFRLTYLLFNIHFHIMIKQYRRFDTRLFKLNNIIVASQWMQAKLYNQ